MATPRDIASLMFTVGRLLRERVMTGSSASYLHLATLQYVADHKQPLMREIAQYLRISPPSATSLVQTLVKQGELRRIEDAKDRRIVRLDVTAKGHKTLSEGNRRKHDLLQDVISKLGEGERKDLKAILEKIIKSAEAHT